MNSVFFIKIISAMLYPLGLVSVFALLSLICHVRGRVFGARCIAFAAVLTLVLSSNPIIARNLAYSLERQYPQKVLEAIGYHDAIIVLGGGLRIPLPPAKHVQLSHGSDRYWHAAKLYKAGKAGRIILSGGNLYPQNGVLGEAYYAAELLQQWGVPKGAIDLELGSRTTAENLKNTQKLLGTGHIQSALLVTSAVHMPRAYYLFSDLPILLTPASADVMIRQQTAPTVFSYIPSASSLNLTTVALHEYYGLWYARFRKVFY